MSMNDGDVLQLCVDTHEVEETTSDVFEVLQAEPVD